MRVLNPGESDDLGSDQTVKLIEFHRGGDFGDALYELSQGEFEFRVRAEGWELVQTSDTEKVVGVQIP